jgi:hypothetical protein
MTHTTISDSDYPSSFKFIVNAINSIGQEMNERNEKAKRSTSSIEETVESTGAMTLEFSYKVMLDGLKYSKMSHQLSKQWWKWPVILFGKKVG